MTHGVDGGVSGFGGVRVRRSLRINRIHRGFIVRRAMSVRHCRLVSFIEAFESFPLRHAFMGMYFLPVAVVLSGGVKQVTTLAWHFTPKGVLFGYLVLCSRESGFQLTVPENKYHQRIKVRYQCSETKSVSTHKLGGFLLHSETGPNKTGQQEVLPL